MEGLSKLEALKEEDFGTKEYLKEMKMEDARLHFRIRSRTIKCKMNQPSDARNKASLWRCSACGQIDSQKHLMICPSFRDLREGKSLESDEDIVEYIKKVLKIREKLDL